MSFDFISVLKNTLKHIQVGNIRHVVIHKCCDTVYKTFLVLKGKFATIYLFINNYFKSVNINLIKK